MTARERATSTAALDTSSTPEPETILPAGSGGVTAAAGLAAARRGGDVAGPQPDPFEAEPDNVALLRKVTVGDEPLTEAEQAEWDAYCQRSREAEEHRDRLGLVDLADVMESGVTEPEMLIGGLLVKDDHHTVFGAKEAAKTWLLLHASLQVVRTGGTVIWVDKEMGRKNIADRLVTLGAASEEVRSGLVYLEYPSMDMTEDSRRLWETLLRLKQPELVVFDAQTELLADASLNENLGTDVEKWAQCYITPARRLGMATVMLDHVGHSENGRPAASRQKGAATKVELYVKKVAAFDRDTVGSFTVEVTKNTVSAPIPRKQSFNIGGEDGRFVFETADPETDPKCAKDAERRAKIREEIIEALEREREHWPLSQSQVCGLVRRKKAEVIEVLKEAALSDLWPVIQRPTARGSFEYELRDE